MSLESDNTREDDPEAMHPHHVLVVGGGAIGWGAASHFADRVDEVTFVGDVSDMKREESVVSFHPRTPTTAADIRTVRDTIGDVDVVVAVGEDSRSLFLAYLCKREFMPTLTLAVLNDTRRQDAFEGIGVEPVLLSELLADRVSNYLHEISGS